MQVISDERICDRCSNNIWMAKKEKRWLLARPAARVLTCTECGRGYLADIWEMKRVFREIK